MRNSGSATPFDLLDLRREAPASLGEIGLRLRVAEVDLGDDREHRHLEQDGVQPRPADRDVDLAGDPAMRLDAHEALVELEEPEEVDEVALEEAPAAQVGELVGA